jgi:hypothetical protein
MPLTYLEPVSCYEVKVSETVGKLVFTFDEWLNSELQAFI